jgi:AcrR family transcriptional regulator
VNSERTTRDALMDAAIELLEARGVLAGLNLREVADRVGVTPANIYHLFGSRQGLLRAALQRETDLLALAVAEAADLPYVERRLRMFDVVSSRPRLALTALLALDGDADFEPFPYLGSTLTTYGDQQRAGALPPDLDIEAAHVLGLATSIGIAIYGDAAARQLGLGPEELRDRIRAVFETMLDTLVAEPDAARSE